MFFKHINYKENLDLKLPNNASICPLTATIDTNMSETVAFSILTAWWH